MISQNKLKKRKKTKIANKKRKTKKTNEKTKITKPSLLFYSSFVFITNVISSFYKEYYTYSFLFIVLTITSLIFHSKSTIYTNIVDKVSIFCIISYGGYVLYNKISIEKYFLIMIIITSFLSCIFLFTYGYFTNQYCFHSKKRIGDKYHALLHCITSIGHHLIIFL